MPAKLFTDILEKGVAVGHAPNKTREARQWYRKKAYELGKQKETSLIRESKDRYRTQFSPGRMYFFMYDPKHKATLPYYDSFPLIFPIADQGDTILGLNFHYLPYVLRAKLMDALYEYTNNSKYDESTKLKMAYSILLSASKFRFFKPCLKQYIKKNIRSRLIYVAPEEWDIALWLKVAQFQKKSQSQVWAESRRKASK